MSYWTNHDTDSMLAVAWTCSECGEDTYEADSYPAPKFCCHCGAEIIAIELVKGESRDITPESWKTGAKPVQGTITVDPDKKSATVNLVSSPLDKLLEADLTE